MRDKGGILKLEKVSFFNMINKKFFQCKVCGCTVELLTKAHVKNHNLTLETYCELYPEHAELKYWGVISTQDNMKYFKNLRKKINGGREG